MDNDQKKINLTGVTITELKNFLKKNQISSFRGEQIFNWIYKNRVFSLNNMKNLPDDLIDKLKTLTISNNLSLAGSSKAEDDTAKYLWELSDGETIESVYLPYYKEGRHSVCISTQVGCNMGCSFCATGLGGLNRNLSTGEIVEQVLKIQAFLEFPITNVVFMGMGEPMNNLENVLKAVEILNSEPGLNIGMRKMTISTSGVVPGIKELAVRNKQIGLAISLNAPNDSLRNEIMPVNKKYSLEKLFDTVDEYIKLTNRRVTFEYVIIRDLNDSPEYAYQLKRLLNGLLCHVNLIPVNPVEELNIKRPDAKTINRFKDILNSGGVETTIRKERGVDIKAACGQLKRERDEGDIK